MYKQRAKRALLWRAVLIITVGGLLSAYLHQRSYNTSDRSALFVLLITIILALFMVIAATARFWFRHLWHHRAGYKRG
jgi:hypothetical protein